MNEFFAYWEQFLATHPGLKSLLAWIGVTVLWEGLAKPYNARRGLAFMLAEEVGLNLLHAVAYQAQSEKTPRVIPSDLHFSSVAFSSLSSGLAQLPKRVMGEVILYYERTRQMNRIPEEWGQILERYRSMQRNPEQFTPLEIALNQKTVDGLLATYKESLQVMIDQSDTLVRRLRVAATIGGRVGYFFVKKTYVNPRDVRENVDKHRKRIVGRM